MITYFHLRSLLSNSRGAEENKITMFSRESAYRTTP